MKCRLLRDMIYGPSSGREGEVAKTGTILDVPDAWKLVRMGVASPADMECHARANRTAEQIAASRHAYERADKGVLPEDFSAYDSGVMDGYNPDGSWKPGPNFEDWEWDQRKANSPLIIEE